MKTSILMSIYNGEKYLLAQLESIKSQTCSPDEVVLIDDCSDDGSVSLIKKFIIENKLEQSWRIYQNKANKGWKRNFMEGIDLTSGDIIFFADQDDIWMDQKVEIYCEVLSSTSIEVLISPYIEWRGNDIVIPRMNRKYHKVRLNGSWKNFDITGSGCTLAFRREFYDRVKKYYVDNWAHDDFFRKMGQVDGRLGVLDSPSILRRFHDNNTSLKKRTFESTYKDLESGIEGTKMIQKYIRDLHDESLEKENAAFLDEIVKGYEYRIMYFRTGQIRYLFKTVLSYYGKQYGRMRQVLGDILLVNGKH